MGNDKNISMVAKFREAIQECSLVDMGYMGYPFTWSRRRYEPHHIEECLERFLCSKD